jgi:hypothetical protein
MVNLPALTYSRQLVLSNTYQEYVEQDPPIETVINKADVKDRIMDYLGAVLSRCWFDKELLRGLENNPHRALRRIGVLLPEDLDLKLERLDLQRPRLVIYEWNKERTFKKRICYLQMIMLAGK